MHNYYVCTVPGVVSHLTGQPNISRVSDGNLTITNTTNETSTIPSLTPGTNVTEISVSAYTSVGRGDPVQISHLTLEELPRELIEHFFPTEKKH